MKKFAALFASLLLALAIAGCTHDIAEDKDFGRSEQAQGQPCLVTNHSTWLSPIVGTPGFKTFNVKAMNIGSASCSYKVSIDIYNSGSLVYATPVAGPYTLAPYTGSGPTKTTSQPGPVAGNCSYDIWFKYRPCPTCAEAWFKDVNGPFWC